MRRSSFRLPMAVVRRRSLGCSKRWATSRYGRTGKGFSMKPVEVHVVVNGRRESVPSPGTIAQLLADTGWKATQVVVEDNGRGMPRHRLAENFRNDGDQPENRGPVAGGCR